MTTGNPSVPLAPPDKRETHATLAAGLFTNGVWDMLSIVVPLYAVAVGLSVDPNSSASRPYVVPGPPSATFLLGKVLNAFLLDHIQNDFELLELALLASEIGLVFQIRAEGISISDRRAIKMMKLFAASATCSTACR
mgnify:CR=1 FL=1